MGLSSTLGFQSSKLLTFRLICLLDVEIYPEAFLYYYLEGRWFKRQERNRFYTNHLHLPEYFRAGAIFSLKQSFPF